MTDPLMWTVQMPETGDAELDTLGLLHRVMSLRADAMRLDVPARERIAKYFYERWGPHDQVAD